MNDQVTSSQKTTHGEPTGSSAPTPEISALAIAALVFSIAGFFTLMVGIGFFFILIALIFGIVAMVQIKKRPMELRGGGMALAAIIISSMTFMILPILAAIAIPSFLKYRGQAYDVMAKSAGIEGQAAQEYYFQQNQEYTDDLASLIQTEHMQATDPSVTFHFLSTGPNGYSFYTQHAKGSGATFLYEK